MTAVENRVTPIASVEIYGRTFTPKVGDYVVLGDKLVGECLLPGDETVDSGYRGCQFRWPVNLHPIDTVAIDVKITGRTLQYRPHQGTTLWVKVRVTFVGDCEPDTHVDGWLCVAR